jgi:HD-GYP domain-containing protein (c-di-GMP phosphodiesterase class II)/ABC-type amino acid transport substrate-binding protein
MFSKKITLRLTVMATFMLVTGLTALVALSMNYYFSHQLAKEAASNQFVHVAEKIGERTASLEKMGVGLVKVLAESPRVDFPLNESGALPVIPLMASLLLDANELYSSHVGYPDGSYIQLINLDVSDDMRLLLDAAPSDRWLETRVLPQGEGNKLVRRYLDSELQVRLQLNSVVEYDPRNRSWYKLATGGGINKIPPYLVTLINVPGITYVQRLENNIVVGANLVLSLISGLLESEALADTNQAFMFDQKGTVTEHWEKPPSNKKRQRQVIQLTEEERQFIQQNPFINVGNEKDYPPFDFTVSGEPKGYSIELVNILADMVGLKVRYTNGLVFNRLYEAFLEGEVDMLASMFRSDEREELGLFTQPTKKSSMLVVTRASSQENIHDIAQLNGHRIAVPREYVVTDYLLENYPNFVYVDVDTPLQGLLAISEGRADAMIEMDIVLHYLRKYYFLETLQFSSPLEEFDSSDKYSLHLLVGKDKPELQSIFSKALAQISDADKAALESKWLTFDTKKNNELDNKNLALGQLPAPILLDIAQNSSLHAQVNEVQIAQQNYYAYVVPAGDGIRNLSNEFLGMLVSEKEVIRPYLIKVKLAIFVTLLTLLLFIPFILYTVHLIVDPIRLLVDENDKVVKRAFDDVKSVPSKIKEIHQLSSSMVYMSGSIKDYQQSQKELMDSFIELIARAIDDKSPYTGAHCGRVPKLAFMLAEAACESDEPAFESFNFNSEDEWREFKIAAWLHDCGKVTTPEHIVDKGSKLEAIYNRIHEVRMRFEVLWRDAEISYWQGVSRTPEAEPVLKKQLNKQIEMIKQDFAFVAACNVGGETMHQDELNKLAGIAKQKWQRNLDDTLGLSPADEKQLGHTRHSTPHMESLLADKQVHIVAGNKVRERDAKYGFNMLPPKDKQNLGELYNLSIKKGTLTPEDRYIINEHIISTIEMLETLPLPQELSRVPEYAGAHHETMLGKGYPRGLTKEQMSLPARMMAIADIFEALTASDRPYKKAKSLSESLDILHQMSVNQHIDSDLFELFINSRIYMDYANAFLDTSQVDEIDIKKYQSST